MAPNHYKGLLRKVLLGFITEQDPVLAMLEWVARQTMLIEAEAKVGAENLFFRRQGEEDRHSAGHDLPLYSVVTLALMICHGVNGAGNRKILAIEPMFDESEDPWRAFFGKLKSRSLRKVCLCISDAHSGIQAAVKKELVGTSWQRCQVHFMRNILAEVPHKAAWRPI